MLVMRRSAPNSIVATVMVALAWAAVTIAPAASAAPPVAEVATLALPAQAQALAAPGAAPALTVTPIVTGLDTPWDLFFTPDGTMIYNQRAGGLWARTAGGARIPVTADFSDLYAEGEVGLMGMVVDPDFATAGNRNFYTCQGHRDSSGTDIRVIKWRINAGYTAATRVGAPLIAGINQTAAVHAGCRLRFDNNKLLYVSTGDSATGPAPQDLGTLNGKVLRVDRDGNPPASNPFAGSANTNARLVFTRGHRNPQGLSLRPGTNEMWSVEQGTDRDDEINRLVSGGNYGWNPVRPPSTSYDQSTPMTDPNVPGARPAVFTSGFPTLALSGGTWLSGTQWGRWNGTFLVLALKDTSAWVLSIEGQQSVVRLESPAELNTGYRLRSPLQGPDGSLYVTTSNGGGTDQIWRVTPHAGPGDGRCYGSATDPASPVAVATTGPTTDAYVIGLSGALYFRSISPDSGFTNLGGIALQGPTAVSWGGARTDVFVVGTDSALYHIYRSGGSWSGWERLGGILTSSPVAVSFAEGTLDVFARGLDRALWTIRWTGSAWTGWTSVGGVLSGAPGAAVDPDTHTGRVGVRGLDGGLYELSMTAGGHFSPFTATGVPICSAPAYSARRGDGVESFSWASSDASGEPARVSGSTVTQLGGTLLGSPAMAYTGGSGYVVLGRGGDSALWVFDARTGPGGWRSLGGLLR
jgi:glucose/arabinose dehydrogenase